jgi:KipI family sensor histidine kinase inhibitor
VTELRVLPAGRRGALLEVPDNETAVRLAGLLRDRGGLVDVVAGHRTVLVTWEAEPPRAELEELAQQALAGGDAASGNRVELVVRYDGPDLADVARLAGLSTEEVVARHVEAEYVVAFLGFQPGFAYLLGGDERLAVPRLDDPRTRVPAGSVAIAGPYSGVYPRESPGGWRLLGRTDTVLFDAARTPPALLAAGDRVRFVSR